MTGINASLLCRLPFAARCDKIISTPIVQVILLKQTTDGSNNKYPCLNRRQQKTVNEKTSKSTKRATNNTLTEPLTAKFPWATTQPQNQTSPKIPLPES
mmetsp:Transcript_9751/g.17583  ORF Transcript_9751/g.17583 Transcript_9751/m.17583 type:complete len:99 (-) Transcript_9751:108-404(-)